MSQSSLSLEKAVAKIRAQFRSCCKSIPKIPRRVWNFLFAFSKSLWRGELDEKETVVLRRNIWSALWRCWPHLVTLSATVPLAYLNLAGYFVGADLQGDPSRNYQAFYQLCLQVTAKVLELLVVASLGTIFIDVLSMELLSGSNGLPLGLLSSKQRFKEVQYLFSPEFRFGLGGYRQWRTRLAFALLIIISLFLSLFVGPSVALLVIPTARTDWSGGGASLWLWGDNHSLWPSRLTNEHIGPPYCVSPNATTLSSEGFDTPDCIWSGYSPLLEFFKQAHLTFPTSFKLHDGIVDRDISLGVNYPPVPTSAYTIHLATGAILEVAAQFWYDALTVIPKRSRYRPLFYRDREATTGYAKSWLPAVRTSCDTPDSFLFNRSNDSSLQKVGKYPFLTSHDVSNGLDLLLPTNLPSSAQVDTQWIDIPQSAVLSNGSVTNLFPSALINIALPNQTNSSLETFLTCSVDARWVMGKYKGGPIAPGSWSSQSMRYVQAVDLQGIDPFSTDSRLSQPVQMDLDWLQNLTPATSNGTNSTSLASILTAMGFNRLDGSPEDVVLQVILSVVETVVAAVVTDGMSRIGLTTLFQARPQDSNQDYPLPAEPLDSTWERFMAGTYKFPAPSTPGTYTPLDWTVEVSGLAYRADSNAYKLALAVLFVHAALALAHIAYVVCTRVFCTTADSYLGYVCDTWDSVLGPIILAARSGVDRNAGVAIGAGRASGTATLFENAGAGIRRYRTMKTEVRIRAKQIRGYNNPSIQARGTGANDQQVEILFGQDENTLARAGFRKLEVGKAYG